MKLKRLLLTCTLALAIVLGGCGKKGEEPGKVPTPTEAQPATPTEGETPAPTEGLTPAPTDAQPVTPTEGEKPAPTEVPKEETAEEKAIAAYNALLKAVPAIDTSNEELYNVYMNYEQNLVKFGEHYDTYAIYDINQDGIPELITTTMINYKWLQVFVFTYADDAVALLNDPLNPMGNGTFDQNATANGSYSLRICEDKHIHNVWKGMTPIGEMEEDYAYAIEDNKLVKVECTVSGSDKAILFDDIAKRNENIKSEKEEPTVEMKVAVDYHKVPELYSKCLTEADMKAFNAFVEAWLNYEPKAKIDHPSQQPNLWGMIRECFFLAYGDFDEERGFRYDDEYVYFPYVTSSKAEHDEIIAAFEKRVNSFYAGIDESEEGVELAKHIYINFNKSIAYDYDAAIPGNATFANSSGYTAMMYGSGICMSFARAYSYLLRQVGLESFTVSGLPSTADILAHEWSVIKVGDKYYFADPTWDYVRDPEMYSYFCFGLNKREENGYPEAFMTLCENGNIPMVDYITIEREDME